MLCAASPTRPPDRLDGPVADGGGLPAKVALLTSVPPLGTSGGMIGTAPGMFGTGIGADDRDPGAAGPNPGGSVELRG
jgi:hypothetical protein